MVAKRKKKPAAKAATGPSVRAVLPRRWWAWSLVLVILVAGALLHVHARLQVVHLGYDLSEAAKENRTLLTERRKLQVEVATLRSPRRLRKLASEKLGLVEPKPEQIIRPRSKPKGELALVRQGH